MSKAKPIEATKQIKKTTCLLSCLFLEAADIYQARLGENVEEKRQYCTLLQAFREQLWASNQAIQNVGNHKLTKMFSLIAPSLG
jgi:hypothetical protein